MAKYVHPGAPRIAGRHRCKTRHSPKTPARCRLARNHDGRCWFGWWDTGTHLINLDLPLPMPKGV